MHQNKFPAFTLIEMILVVALTMFLLVVTAQSFVNSASQFSFSNAAEKVQELIRQARSLAISGKAQIDYTDYNNDTCKDKAHSTSECQTKNASTGGDDYVTPAHYGVNFDKTNATITLFADNHSPTATEGKYNPGTNYANGDDIVLETYPVPSGMQLIIPGNASSATIFFSPIFADVSSDPATSPTDPFFRFGISAKFGDIVRKRCSQIHMLAGISEPMNDPNPGDPNKCSP